MTHYPKLFLNKGKVQKSKKNSYFFSGNLPEVKMTFSSFHCLKRMNNLLKGCGLWVWEDQDNWWLTMTSLTLLILSWQKISSGSWCREWVEWDCTICAKEVLCQCNVGPFQGGGDTPQFSSGLKSLHNEKWPLENSFVCVHKSLLSVVVRTFVSPSTGPCLNRTTITQTWSQFRNYGEY